MDETTRALIDSITVTSDAPIRINDKYSCTVFYDCVRLCPNDLARLAAHAMGHDPEPDFDVAVGLAYTGIFFAAAIAGGRQVAILTPEGSLSGVSVQGKKVVLVDDVIASGGRLRQSERLISQLGGRVVAFACIIDRSDGRFAGGSQPLWSAYQTTMG